ncbi:MULTISPECIES: L-histidine N(alpha)-methyltransferase [unclassified Okeania]|uniref:L-histidine N(alpha)-methyltransferase n=1 Tax=unclassified Okeania TaxID=2634635 RepID=UPI0013B685F4|nr:MULTISPECIES: L-histidine N(alpha)-methyltransferase [unclassified Okeania]NES78467.1 L-histidine N(alpha)-methyltransferase [Okeania sp. SIO1H4]NET15750.1 L-histidine N(alpha)-methyltransferase [Okeania sp. SIO1H6]NET21768.1 L-histidine N(alpha)-methyltransferase [Okeania sp. SIO1H5]NET95974.1 L-histidine N(alpha)-methyltransferase [Okeania sp. SIO1H2]
MTDFQTSFLCDVKSLFLQQQEENLAPYLYSTPNIEDDSANGEGFYQELISQNLNYYLYKEEIELINNKASQIAAYVPPGSNVIEFGLGTDIAFKNKSLPFLKEIKQLKSYVPIDLCQTYLDQSEEILSRELPEISVEKINTDFIKKIDLIKNFTKPVVFLKEVQLPIFLQIIA